MSIAKKALAGTSLAALLFSGAAYGEDPCSLCPDGGGAPQSRIIIDQIQTGDLWSSMDVHIETKATDAAASATTVGNTAAGLITTGDLDFDANQAMHGSVEAAASVDGANVSGTAFTAATAYGNASTAGTWMGNSQNQSHQTMTGDVSATSVIDLNSSANVSASTTGIANVATTSGEFGDNNAFQTQTSAGSVNANTLASVGGSSGTAAFVATASGNTVYSAGHTTTALQGAVQTTAMGERIEGHADIQMGTTGSAFVATTAAGNSYLLNNEFGYASLGREGSELYQGNESEVLARTFVDLGVFSDQAAVSAYGVGNSAAVTNLGSDTALHTIQSNFADVTSQVQFSGVSTTGGVVQVSSIAIGNTASAGLCVTCGQATLQGTTTQFNSASISATGSIQATQIGSLTGSATAIGNSATYQSSGH
ncbi:MAG: holdfast anchor protein HfaD [Pseudomonadota bacterium]